MNNYLKDNLPNAVNCIVLSLASVKRWHLKQNGGHTSFMIKIHHFPIIIEPKVFKERKKTIEKSFPKYRCNWTFKRKAFDFQSS